jgi:hypothetical protein
MIKVLSISRFRFINCFFSVFLSLEPAILRCIGLGLTPSPMERAAVRRGRRNISLWSAFWSLRRFGRLIMEVDYELGKSSGLVVRYGRVCFVL